MNRSDEQLTDELIGEAVLSLLKEKGPINMQALIMRLRAMEARERDAQRREAITRVIAEISNTMVSKRRNGVRERKDWDRDNVHSLFGESQQAGSSKKH